MARVVQGGVGAENVADIIAGMDAKQHELGRLSRSYAASLQVRNTNLKDLRHVLAEKSGLLEMRLYQKIDFKTGTPGLVRVVGIFIPPVGDIAVRDLGLAEEMDANVSLLLSGSPEATEKAAATLYQQLLAPFAADLTGLKRLYVAPDGSLNLVSFGLLRGPDGRRVMDQLVVRLVQTGRDLLRPVPDTPAKGLIAVGGIDFDLAVPSTQPDATPATQAGQAEAIVDRVKRTRGDTLDSLRNGFGALAHSKEEVETIADLYGDARRDETVVLADGSAKAPTPTKDWLLGLSPPRVLHLATHGFYRAPKQPSDQPMLLAGIALAGANRSLKDGGDGGILYALEAQDLNLEGTELVVLSACQTALGQYDYGDGVSGLVRALRVAGARNVLVTLRSVDDEQAADSCSASTSTGSARSRATPPPLCATHRPNTPTNQTKTRHGPVSSSSASKCCELRPRRDCDGPTISAAVDERRLDLRRARHGVGRAFSAGLGSDCAARTDLSRVRHRRR